jgi:5-formyltetrahydrofolate cyclo-ligase
VAGASARGAGELAPERLRSAADALSGHVLARLGGLRRIAAYVPMGREPGSLRLLDMLRDGGTEVLLPVVVADGLDWARYAGAGELVAGPLGTRAPTGPRLGRPHWPTADAVLVPALAVDHRGVRLGRGGGYYDRALAALPPGARLARSCTTASWSSGCRPTLGHDCDLSGRADDRVDGTACRGAPCR